MKKILIYLIIALFVLPLTVFGITETDARNIANETLLNLMELNLILGAIKKKEDINQNVKANILKIVAKMKTLKSKVNGIKRAATPQQMKMLDEQFNKGQYAVALKKAVITFFENVKRIRTVSGGEEIANMVVI